MSSRSYGQYCGVARALELVGERWALLIVRDLILGPKRFTDLQRGLPRIPSNVLSSRLKELEQAGIAERRVLPRPSGAVVYELTPYGRELEQTVVQLLRWGSKSLGPPDPDDTVNPSSFLLGLRTAFRADAAADLRATYEIHLDGCVVHARVDDGSLELSEGPAAAPDLTVEADLADFGALLRGDPNSAAPAMRLSGDAKLLDRFSEVFRLPGRA